jgi:kynureninase
MQFINSLDFARKLDDQDQLKDYRKQFLFPQHNGKETIYFCGNSLGLQPVKTREYILQELEDWKNLGVEGHFQAKHPWFPYHEFLRDSTAKLTGSLPAEVVVMNSLTTNLHLLMVSFYRPDSNRYKIIFEKGPFPSDRYALASQAEFHAPKNGFDPEKALIELEPRKGENFHRTEDILDTIDKHKSELALVMIGGVNYYTGQLFDMKEITRATHKAGAVAGFDLAHATGNVELKLHDWDVDFAAWCSYKYLNGGPGAVGGAFVHERYTVQKNLPRFAGWWGNDPSNRFTMPEKFEPVKSADAWQLSNAPVLSMAALRASMEIFDRAGMESLVAKSKILTSYLSYIINEVNISCKGANHINVITPETDKGCQLSLVIEKNGKAIHDYLTSQGIISDWRHPDVIRVAPVPLYNNFEDVFSFGKHLMKAVQNQNTPSATIHE